MTRILGIDLGTTNSVMAVVEGDKPIVIPNAEGDYLTPSVVGFTKTGERLVGKLAKRQAVANPERTVISIKRKMGTDYKVKIDDKEYTPQEISAMILQKLKLDAEAYLGETISKAVITVPAHFDDAQRQATKDAGTIAGLEVVRILNEPTAAAIAYGLDKQDRMEKILVFDLGGGTFDVSILEIGGGVFQVISTAGDNYLGGDDWDQRIIDWMIEEFMNEHGIDLRLDRRALQRLKEAAEQAKIELSTKLKTTIKLPFIAADATGPKHLQLELTRKKFEEMTKDLVERLEGPVKRALEDAGLTPAQIDKVILVGGSTRMPMVQEMARKLLRKEPLKDIDPDKVVAMGAALQAGIIGGKVKEMVLLDVVSLSLGVETAGGGFVKIIPRNTQIPVKKTKIFTTVADGQTSVEIHVLQGERELAKYNKSLARFELTGIPPAPRGVPKIEVTFEIDQDGILHVSAKDLATGNKQTIIVHSSLHLSKEEVERMVQEAQKYAEQDAKIREQQLLITRANVEIDIAEKVLREYGDRVPEKLVTRCREALEQVRLSLNSRDFERLKKDVEELRMATYAITTELYNIMEKDMQMQELQKSMGEGVDSSILQELQNVSKDDILSWFKKKG